MIVGAPKEKNVRHNCFGLRGVWSDGDASSGHAGSGASLPKMCAKGERRGQTSSSRKEVGRAKSNPRTRVLGFVGPICRFPHSYFPSAFFGRAPRSKLSLTGALAIEPLPQGDRAFNSTYPPEPIRVSVALAPRRANGNAMQLTAILEGPSMAL